MQKNKIEEILTQKEISIRQLSKGTGLSYSHAYSIVSKDDLWNTNLATLEKIAQFLQVSITDLYENK